MSRLIDGEKLYKELCEFITTQCDDMGTGLWILDLVNSQPTAYDVEAVVRELEEYKKNWHYQCNPKNCNTNISCMSCQIARMVEIIKRGGRNG